MGRVGRCPSHEDYYTAAEELGEKAAEKGWAVVYGGGKGGVMGRIAKGVTSKGGELIGVAPTFMESRDVLYDKCTEFIFTKDMRERKRAMAERADAFIVMPGGFGTLEEFFEIVTEKTLGLSTKPIAVVNIRGIYDEMVAMAKHMQKEAFLNQLCFDSFYVAKTVDEAIDFIEKDSKIEKKAVWMKYEGEDEE